MTVCADFGGTSRDGTPCQRQVTDGPCWDHSDEAEAIRQAVKKEVVALVSEGTHSLAAIAKSVGYNPATLWKWRQADEAFDTEMEKAQKGGEEIRLHLVEDSMFSRIIRGEAAASETIFWLKNRAPHRWRDRTHIQHSGEIKGGDVHVYLPGNDRDDLPEQLRRRMAVLSGNGPGGNGAGE